MNRSADMSDNDPMLVQKLIQGDRQAFETIYRKYWWTLFNAVYKRIRDKQKTEDLVQEVFFKLWRRKESLEILHLEAYLKTAARYETLNALSRTKITYTFFEPFHELLQETNEPESKMFSKDLMELVQAYADTLPEKRRKIFLLHVNSRMSTKEIAAALGISQKTVQNQLGTALNGLKPRILPLIATVMAVHYS